MGLGTVLSLLVLLAIALLIGAFFQWRRGSSMKQVVLMVILALVVAVNVAIWTLPTAGGDTPLAEMKRQQQGGE